MASQDTINHLKALNYASSIKISKWMSEINRLNSLINSENSKVSLRDVQIKANEDVMTGKFCGKQIFETKDSADKTKQTINATMREDGKKLSRSYFCNHCNGWHLTSKAEFTRDYKKAMIRRQ
jgi:excinuclease UvrABC ATPase subunit